MKVIRQIIFVILHWTWGIIQTIIGFCVFMCTLRHRHIWLNGSVITEIKGNWGGISIGMFAFVDYMSPSTSAYKSNFVLHEYGHCIQSIIFGPLWLIVFGLPSLIWAGCFEKYRTKHKVSYYSFYTERLADKLGGVHRII